MDSAQSNGSPTTGAGTLVRRRPIALIGFMGSGKSTVGTELAQMSDDDWLFADTDVRTERRAFQQTGVDATVAELFEREGEARFRGYESDALESCLSELSIEESGIGNLVIATGGGIVLREANRRRLRESCFVVWLTAHVETIIARVQAEAHARPLIAAHADRPDDLRTHILTMLGQRAPLYQETAHLVVDTSDREPAAIAREILRKYKRAQRDAANQP